MKLLLQVFVIFSVLTLLSCASGESQNLRQQNSEETKSYLLEINALEKAHQSLKKAVFKNNRDSLLFYLSEDSKMWIDRIVGLASYSDAKEIETLPFYETLVVLAIRAQKKYGQLGIISSESVLKSAFGNSSPLRKAFSFSLGKSWIEGERGFRGLKKTPKVPVFYWVFEDEFWRLDLTQMLPIVSRGLEAIGRKQHWSSVRTALFLIREGMKFPVNRSLLNP